jgi:hypothetical protein
VRVPRATVVSLVMPPGNHGGQSTINDNDRARIKLRPIFRYNNTFPTVC